MRLWWISWTSDCYFQILSENDPMAAIMDFMEVTSSFIVISRFSKLIFLVHLIILPILIFFCDIGQIMAFFKRLQKPHHFYRRSRDQ